MSIEVFANYSYPNFLELAKDSYLFPGRFHHYFTSPKFMSLLKQTDKDKYNTYLEYKSQQIPPDVFVFKVSYLLNPYMSLRYHHFIFNSYEQLGKTMLSFGPIVDVYLKDLVLYHLLSKYMEDNREDKRFPDVYKWVKEAEIESRVNENMAYWTLAFKLAHTKTLIYNKKTYTDAKEFFTSTLVISDIFPFASSFLDDCYVLTWLKMLGFEYRISRFISLSQVSDQVEKFSSDQLAKQLYSEFVSKSKKE